MCSRSDARRRSRAEQRPTLGVRGRRELVWRAADAARRLLLVLLVPVDGGRHEERPVEAGCIVMTIKQAARVSTSVGFAALVIRPDGADAPDSRTDAGPSTFLAIFMYCGCTLTSRPTVRRKTKPENDSIAQASAPASAPLATIRPSSISLATKRFPRTYRSCWSPWRTWEGSTRAGRSAETGSRRLRSGDRRAEAPETQGIARRLMDVGDVELLLASALVTRIHAAKIRGGRGGGKGLIG